MLDGKKILGIIPARAGSKRVPDKNLTLFKIGDELDSLLGWAIKHAKSIKCIDHIVVSTDLTPWKEQDSCVTLLERPTYLAGDKTPMEAVINHALHIWPGYDYGVLLQPTSPLRAIEDTEKCIEIAVRKNGEEGRTGCVSYCGYKRNGAVYVFNVLHFLEFLSLDAAHHYEMPPDRSLDIDYAWQFPVIGERRGIKPQVEVQSEPKPKSFLDKIDHFLSNPPKLP